MLPIMRVKCGAMRGASAMMVASTLTILNFSSFSFAAVLLSSIRLSISAYCGELSG